MAADRAAERQGVLRRNLVIVRAGDGSLHERWLGDGDRGFDLVVSYFGEDPARFRRDDVSRLDHRGGKFEGLYRLLSENGDYLDRYDHVWLPDDDLMTDSDTIDRLFATVAEAGLDVAQPGLTPASVFSHPLTIADPAFRLRYANFVEIMAPCFRSGYLRQVMPLFEGLRFGWGLDFVWARLMSDPRFKAAIVDACVVSHTRPLGRGALYRSDKHPRDELATVLGRCNLTRPPAIGAYAGVTTGGKLTAIGLETAIRSTVAAWRRVKATAGPRWPMWRFFRLSLRQHRKGLDLSPLVWRESAP